MYVNHCGIDYNHPAEFHIDRPNGSGDYLFVYTKVPAFFVYNSRTKQFPAGTVVLYERGAPQNFMASGPYYQNDFIHFNISEEDESFISTLPLLYGVPLTTLDTSVFMSIHHYICIEYTTADEFMAPAIDSLLRYFLIKLAESMSAFTTPLPDESLCEELKKLRSEIYMDASKKWTVSEMADRLHISSSYFQATYKRLFKRSCISDVIFSKIEHAKYLLLATDFSVKRIARLCGYENDVHFSRQFKASTGMTALKYRFEDQSKN